MNKTFPMSECPLKPCTDAVKKDALSISGVQCVLMRNCFRGTNCRAHGSLFT